MNQKILINVPIVNMFKRCYSLAINNKVLLLILYWLALIKKIVIIYCQNTSKKPTLIIALLITFLKLNHF